MGYAAEEREKFRLNTLIKNGSDTSWGEYRRLAVCITADFYSVSVE